jgi:RNA polymerase sigma factor (sigma-70 family)
MNNEIRSERDLSREEETLILAAKDGDTDAFTELYQRHWPKIHATCRRIVGPDNAEDLAQETMFKAWEKIDTFRLGESFAGWLYRISFNTCIDWLRKQNRIEAQVGTILSLEMPIGDDDDRELTLKELVPDLEATSPDEEIPIQITFDQCWSGLAPGEQFSLIFIYVRGGKFKELGWSKGSKPIDPADDEETVKKKKEAAHNAGKYHVKKALQKLERCLRHKEMPLTESQALKLLNETTS